MRRSSTRPRLCLRSSSRTPRTDRIEKLREYQATSSIQRYVILEQKSVGAAVFARRGEELIATALTDADTLDMPEIGVAIPLPELYGGLDLAAETEEDVSPTDRSR